MRHEVMFSGFGGQGVILSAVILGKAAAIFDNKYAVQTQTYGPEATLPDIYVIMSQQGYDKYGADAEKNAIMLIDSDLVHSKPACRYVEIPATKTAKEELGRVIVANIVMLGALVTATGIISKEAMEKAVLSSVPKGTEELNTNALRSGFKLGAIGGKNP